MMRTMPAVCPCSARVREQVLIVAHTWHVLHFHDGTSMQFMCHPAPLRLTSQFFESEFANSEHLVHHCSRQTGVMTQKCHVVAALLLASIAGACAQQTEMKGWLMPGARAVFPVDLPEGDVRFQLVPSRGEISYRCNECWKRPFARSCAMAVPRKTDRFSRYSFLQRFAHDTAGSRSKKFRDLAAMRGVHATRSAA